MMLIVTLGFLLTIGITLSVTPPDATERTFLVKSAPPYRDDGQQGVNPNRPANPSLASYSRSTSGYRVPPSPLDVPPPPSLPQNTPIVGGFRRPNGTDGVIQNITVLLPPAYRPPPNGLYDQLARGKAAGFVYDSVRPTVATYPSNSVNPGFIGPITPQQLNYGVPEPTPIVVDVEFLDRALMNRRPIRLLDATPSQQGFAMEYRQFRDDYYGKWDRLFNERANVEFQRVHIPTAIHFSTDIGTYPTWNDPSALYPQEVFEQYVRRLGINQGDHIIVYARGSLGGMLHAARVWNIFRIYGHGRISVLDGGFEAWRTANLTLTDVGAPIETGNWTASFDPSLVIAYEDLIMPDSNGYCVLNRLCWYNFFDARPKPDFYGLQQRLRDQQTGLGSPTPNNRQPNHGFNGPFSNENQPPLQPPLSQRRSHLPGAKSLPAEDLVRPDGFMLSPTELKLKLKQAGYTAGRESVASGETPEEASMVVLALAIVQDPKVRLYNAGIPEIRLRSPNMITS